jgi:hypothetical protein
VEAQTEAKRRVSRKTESRDEAGDEMVVAKHMME